jgi:hypothetical protein
MCWECLNLLLIDDLFGEQILFEFTGEARVIAPDPFHQHGGVLFFFIAVVFDDGLEFLLLPRVVADSLAICGLHVLDQVV